MFLPTFLCRSLKLCYFADDDHDWRVSDLTDDDDDVYDDYDDAPVADNDSIVVNDCDDSSEPVREKTSNLGSDQV